RRADLLVDDATMAAWYLERIPESVYSIGGFEQWRKDAERTDPRVLFMSMADVSKRDPAEVSAEAFPDLMEVAGEALMLHYRLNPGEDDDGVTLELPIGLLPRLEPARCEWLVPGMVRDKALALLRALPKSLRAPLDPVQALADRAAQIPFGRGSLLDELSALVQRERGVTIPRSAWPVKALPEHMNLRIEVVDEQGQRLATGRDAAELQQRLAARARKHLAAIARKSFGREGMTAWDFDALPPRPEGGGHPCLVDHGATVALTLLDSAEAAAASTRLGVRRFFVLAARQELDYHIGRQPNLARVRMLHAPLGPGEDLLDGLRCVVAERVFMAGQPEVATREAFEQRLAEKWGRIGLTSREVAALVETILNLRQTVALRLARPFPDYCADAREDISEQVSMLVPQGFLRTVPEVRLRELPRYLEAVVVRLRKLDNGNWGRDQQAINALRPLWRRCLGVLREAEAAHAAPPAGVEEHRWLLEELRVSLFAERLGTSVPVSAKRLNDHWAGLGL
ncbi:MAG: DUF3418 domain-containing protein, partial [Phycisphaerae bacterium]|nr:DUF3418 domain-containing protein [Phycisphaerae bacterium]